MREASSYTFRVDTNLLVVEFYEPGYNYKQEYDIAPINRLDETMPEDPECSQLLFHLGMKNWPSLPLLYDFAFQVNKYCPGNRINWAKSFVNIELNKIAKKFVDDNYVMLHTDQDMIDEGDISPIDALNQSMMQLTRRMETDEANRPVAIRKIEGELKKRGIV